MPRMSMPRFSTPNDEDADCLDCEIAETPDGQCHYHRMLEAWMLITSHIHFTEIYSQPWFTRQHGRRLLPAPKEAA